VISRRGLLLSGVLAVGAVGAGALVDTAAVRRKLGFTGEDGTVPDVAPSDVWTAEFTSKARGRSVTMAVMTPAGADRAGLPVCLVLHGRGGSARGMVELGLPRFLTAAQRRFALVALDGGDSYWIARRPGDDPQAMLRDEVPGWLAGLGLAAPRAALGISMGGFGSLVLARKTALETVAVISPALFRNYSDARPLDGFADEASWAAAEPLRHLAELPAGLRLGIWCGEEDPFYDAARLLADRRRPVVASFDHGAHDVGYWYRVLPDALRFVGDRFRG
jgi:hypothetical protein